MKVSSPSSLSSLFDDQPAPGDRFELPCNGRDQGGKEWPLPEALQALGLRLNVLEDAQGHPLEARVDPVKNHFVLSNPPASLGPAATAAWLEYQAPGRFRLVVEEKPALPFDGSLTTDQGVEFQFTAEDEDLLHLGNRHASLPEFDLALRAARLATHAGFDRLICLPMVRDMELLEHQVRTAKTVLRRLRGRALLCDEVGLGKTIEAGLILDELHMRGLVRSVLILVPPALIEQWQGEMRRKFGLAFVSHDDQAFRERGPGAWGEFDHIIASMHTAKREPHRSAILARQWDMVIVDEAHHLRNRTTQLWRFASEVRKQFILLLTATPVQNNLDELFNLVTLLEPGLLSTSRQFQRRFVDRKDKLTPRNVDELHTLLSEVMVRNRRSTVGLQFTRRWARTLRVPLLPAEQSLYEDVTRFVRENLRRPEKGGFSRMALLTLQMALGSSSQAAAGTLERLSEQAQRSDQERARLADLAQRAQRQSENAKVDQLLQLLAEFSDKMVIFTQFRATQELLLSRLLQVGHEIAVFHGGLTRLQKEAAIERFRGPARLLLATESGSEGRNLQFAHAICNFDLPWNPMKIEQRIGRLSRIGQTHDVHVFNLVAQATVEAAVLHLLEAKLSMFELVIGEIDMILGNLDEEREFQEVIADLWAESANVDDFSRRMEELGDHLVAAKNAYLQQRAVDDRIFADRFTPES